MRKKRARMGTLIRGGSVELSPAEALKPELEKKEAEIKRLARELDQARMKSASSSVSVGSDRLKKCGREGAGPSRGQPERSQMRTLVDQLRDKLGSGVVVLGSASNGNVSLIVGVTKDLTSRIQAGKVIGPVAQKVGGKGGGRPIWPKREERSGGAGLGAGRGVYRRGIAVRMLGSSIGPGSGRSRLAFTGVPMDNRIRFIRPPGKTDSAD